MIGDTGEVAETLFRASTDSGGLVGTGSQVGRAACWLDDKCSRVQ